MSPYEQLPDKAFWKLAVANRSMFDVSEIWDPKFRISNNSKIVTYGSCSAQHIGNAIKDRGFNWLITEKAPGNCSKSLARKYNYGVFSSRTGNIYTTSLLKQWTEWALNKSTVPDEIWEKDGRFYDPFRPRIEPNGFESLDELKFSQQQAIECFSKSILNADYFFLTLGLTESWFNKDGYEYPMCPGTVAGEHDESTHDFVNQQYNMVLASLRDAMQLMREVNSKLKFILTVAPGPLTATNSNKHVVVASMASKSILRAVADQLATNRSYVDYFPSYEIINSPMFKGVFFEPNLRNVSSYGLNFVMDNFFECLENKYGISGESSKPRRSQRIKTANEICDEELLDAFKK